MGAGPNIGGMAADMLDGAIPDSQLGLPPEAPSGAQLPPSPAANPLVDWNAFATKYGPMLLRAGDVASGRAAVQSMMGPSDDLQKRVDQTHALPDGYTPPAMAPQGAAPAQLRAPQMPGSGVPGFDYGGNRKLGAAGFNDQVAGGQAAADAQAAAENARAAAQAQAANERIALAQQQQRDYDGANQQAMADMQKSQESWKQYRDSKVDPNHWWATRSEPQKAMAALGLAFSQMGAAISGTKPVDLISDAIDRDVHAQEANAARLKDFAQGQDNLFARNYALTKDAIAARALTKGQYIDGIIAQGDATAAKSASAVTQGNWMRTRGVLEQQKSQEDRTAYGQVLQNKLVGTEITKNNMAIAQQQRMLQAGSGAPVSEKDREDLEKQEAAVRNLEGGARENSETLKDIGFGDRARHLVSSVTGGVVSDSPKYGKLSAAQEQMAVNANLAQGIPTAQTEKQYENMREGANTPSSPDKGVSFGKTQVGAAREALAAKYAAVYRVPIEQARTMVLQKFGSPWDPDHPDMQKVRAQYGVK